MSQMSPREAFHFTTMSFRLVRLMSELQNAWTDKLKTPIGEFLDAWLEKQAVGNLETYSFVNQQILITHLYMVVVWYVEHQHHNLFTDLFNGVKIADIRDLNERYKVIPRERRPNWPELDATVKQWDKEKAGEKEQRTLTAFLEHVRNAVSHGRVQLLEGNQYRFEDQYPGENKVPHTRIEMTYSTAAQLTDALYLSLALDVYPHTS